MEFPVVLGKRIRELRKKAGLSQDQAAERAEISGKYLGQVERGEVNVSAIILHRLFVVFGVKIVDFYDTSHLTVHQHVKLPRSGRKSASKIDHPPGSCNPPVHRRREGDGQRGNDR